MNSTQRKAAYAAILVLNAAAIVCSQQDLFPASWAGAVHACSLVLAMLMKEFGAQDAPAAPEKTPDA